MYMIVCDSQIDGQMLYLVDRTRNKKRWWSENKEDGIVFESKGAVVFTLRKLKFNNPRIIETQRIIL